MHTHTHSHVYIHTQRYLPTHSHILIHTQHMHALTHTFAEKLRQFSVIVSYPNPGVWVRCYRRGFTQMAALNLAGYKTKQRDKNKRKKSIGLASGVGGR